MTLLNKIDFLLNKNGLNKGQLSTQADIPYSTVDNFYKKGVDNMKLSTFKKLCSFFQVDMTSMAYDELEIQPYDPERMHTTPREQEIIKAYRRADSIDQTSICRTLGIDEAEGVKRGETA